MAKVLETYTIKIGVDTKEIQPLVALCKNQMDLINDLHARANSSVLDMRVREMRSSIDELRIDEHLTYIQHEAFVAGFEMSGEGCDCERGFTEWMERDE